MRRLTQSIDDLMSKLSILPTEWRDDTADRIIAYLDGIAEKESYSKEDLKMLLDQDFDIALTVFRL